MKPAQTVDAHCSGAYGFARVKGCLNRSRAVLLGEIADERGESPARTLIEVSLENDLGVAFVAENVGHEKPERVGPMLAHPLVHVGASDGGAHITSFSTYGDTGYLFSQFVRGSHHFTLEQAVKKITADTAEIRGLEGRGTIAEGKAADLVVFDPARIGRGAEHAVFDMPGRGMRYVRDSVGVDAVVVNGAVAYRDGEYMGAGTGTICTQ